MRLDLVVGPNGSGKSTLVSKVIEPVSVPGTVFVNADEIARQRWPDEAEAKSYEAAQVAARTRESLIKLRRPFIAETVFSHPSKLELITTAQQAGFHVALHVMLIEEDLTVRRVRQRIASGGHSVPEEKIRGRYQRLWPLVREALILCDSGTVYDTSVHGSPVIVARVVRGVLVGAAAWPAWTPAELSGTWPDSTP